jgi:SAM-dependent methyltransferase
MRDWKQHDQYITKLYSDIYPQPDSDGHTELARQVIDKWLSKMTTCHSVLDVGCGTGFCQRMFEKWDVQYEGICMGEDYMDAVNHGRNVKKMDFNFLEYQDDSFDMIFSRHSLEHSPMPLLTLMEWARVSKNWLGLVLPAPEWYTYKGHNHYSVMNMEQIRNILGVAGWNIMWEDINSLEWDNHSHEMRPNEYWIMSEKKR